MPGRTTFATESVVLISSGFAFSNILLDYSHFTQKEKRTPHEAYTVFRNLIMLLMFSYCTTYFLLICWVAEVTHTDVKEFGTEVR